MTNHSDIHTSTSVAALNTQLRHHIVYRNPSELKPNPRNARKHGKKQIHKLVAMLQAHGFINPMVIDEDDMLLAGHGRLMAALAAGMDLVPTLCVRHLTPRQKRAYMLADNKSAELSTWDDDILIEEFKDLAQTEDIIELTGFSTCEVDNLLDTPPVKKSDPADDCPELQLELPAVSKCGDVWLLGGAAGEHRLLCGDATNPVDFKTLMAGRLAQMVITDAPYNLKVSGLSVVKRHDEFRMGSGEMSSAQFTEFLSKVMINLKACSDDGSIQYYFMDYRHIQEMMAAGVPVFGELKQLCVWAKDNGGMGAFYRSQHELVFIFKNGTAAHINNFGLGGNGRYRTNVWTYPGVNSFRRGRLEELDMHPTCKPVVMIADAMRDCSRRNGIVLDPFMGSGTTLIAAEKTGRIAYGMELDPHYVDVAIRRWEAFTGKSAVHATSGLTFVERSAQRGTGEGA